ncbi:MAG: hypothetical protein E7646_06045 [Ruminococcaceae bacterium]|nr:hypothetical protein [Oscillospiraceae bacterium]
MLLYAPAYYKDFHCIADKCRHNCCIGWEIDVDGASLKKYQSLTQGYSTTIKESVETDPTPHFRLDAKKRCPHLDENGLCRIISELGEDYLCEICREHPRFYNFTPRGAELGIGLACEEACRIILSSDHFKLEAIGEIDGDGEDYYFDPLIKRQEIFNVLSDPDLSHSKKLQSIAGHFDPEALQIEEEALKKLLGSLEYLNEEDKAIICDYSSDVPLKEALEKPLERALGYFVYRHCSNSQSSEEFQSTLWFSLLCYSILRSVCHKNKVKTKEELIPYARMFSEEIEYSEDNTDTLTSFIF